MCVPLSVVAHQECFFTLEMAYEGEVSPEDYNDAPQLASKYATAIQEMTTRFNELRQQVAMVDDDDFKATLADLQVCAVLCYALVVLRRRVCCPFVMRRARDHATQPRTHATAPTRTLG